jgi:hypothetical protein
MQLSYVRAQWVAQSLLLCLFSAVLSAQSPTYVNDAAGGNNDVTSWENAFTSLQSALGSTASGGIWVAAGTHAFGLSGRLHGLCNRSRLYLPTERWRQPVRRIFRHGHENDA